MAAATEVIQEVLDYLSSLVAADGGSMGIAEFAESESRLTVGYHKGVNEACATCVIDKESLAAFIDEGIRARGVQIADIRVVEDLTLRSQ